MRLLGYLEKTTSSKIYTDNASNPTIFHTGNFRNGYSYNTLGNSPKISFKFNHFPVFEMSMKLSSSLEGIASGVSIWIKDVDTGHKYFMVNSAVDKLFKDLFRSVIVPENGIIKATFKLVKNGQSTSIDFVSQSELDNIIRI